MWWRSTAVIGCGAWCGRADACAPLRFRHAAGPASFGTVGHQAYPHKILLTGRLLAHAHAAPRAAGSRVSPSARKANTTRLAPRIPRRPISSASLGFAVARDLKGESNNVVAVIGDGAMSAGMAYEAMTNAGVRKERLIVVLNDNDMSIAPPVGAMSAYLARLVSRPFLSRLPQFRKRIARAVAKADGSRRAARRGIRARNGDGCGTLFEEMGFYYVGPIDGTILIISSRSSRTYATRATARSLVHVVTKKGKGYAPAEASADKYHGVSSSTF